MFKKKIQEQNIPINVCSLFENYDGIKNNYNQSLNYIRDIFHKTNKNNSNRTIISYVVSAINIKEIRQLYRDIIDNIALRVDL